MSNPLGDLISGGEGGYGSFNRGRAGDAHGMTIDFSDMTLAEVQAAQHLDRHDPNRLFAVGKYQIIPSTMDNAVEHLRLDPNQKFTPELQERIFADYLIAEKRPAIESYIRGDAGATLHGAQKAAAMEWASVDDPDTPGSPYKAYIGVSNNHSSIRANRIGDALNTMRAEYRADIARGLKPDEAWSAVTHVAVSHEPTASSHASDPNAAYVRHTLEQGAHSPAVKSLQADLARLGYIDHRSQPLTADGIFGIDTLHAVERFQHDHHLTVDGEAGPRTQQALQVALREWAATPSLEDARHPDHALFEQALSGVRALDAQHGHPTDQHSRNLAAALTVEARREGLTRIDRVALGDNANRIFAMQSPASPWDPPKYASIGTMTAMRTPVAQSVELTEATKAPPVSVDTPPATRPHAMDR